MFLKITTKKIHIIRHSLAKNVQIAESISKQATEPVEQATQVFFPENKNFVYLEI